MHATHEAKVLGPADGKAGQLGGIGVRFMIDGAQSGGGFSLVEHPMPPRALGAPLHRHTREDEYSYVLEGRVGALLGDDVVYGEPGDLIFKPRGQWHSFWNAGDQPARILEIISPAPTIPRPTVAGRTLGERSWPAVEMTVATGRGVPRRPTATTGARLRLSRCG